MGKERNRQLAVLTVEKQTDGSFLVFRGVELFETDAEHLGECAGALLLGAFDEEGVAL